MSRTSCRRCWAASSRPRRRPPVRAHLHRLPATAAGWSWPHPSAAGELRATPLSCWPTRPSCRRWSWTPWAGAEPEQQPERAGPPRPAPAPLAAVVLAATDNELDPRLPGDPPGRFGHGRPVRAPPRCFSTVRPSCTWSTPTSGPAGTTAADPGNSLLEACARPAAPAVGPTLAEQLAEARQLGLDGAAWVARGHGPEALAAACAVPPDAERVVLPAVLGRPARDRPGSAATPRPPSAAASRPA